jgi:hypothetical protein
MVPIQNAPHGCTLESLERVSALSASIGRRSDSAPLAASRTCRPFSAAINWRSASTTAMALAMKGRACTTVSPSGNDLSSSLFPVMSNQNSRLVSGS